MSRKHTVAVDHWRTVARGLKHKFDEFQTDDNGWYTVDFDHLAFGRAGGPSIHDRIPGVLIPSTDQPGDEAEAVVVLVGFTDPYTGDVWLADGMTIPAPADQTRTTRTTSENDAPDRWLPAVVFYEDGNLAHIAAGMVHQGEDTEFQFAGLWPQLAEALDELIEEAVRIARHGKSEG